MKYLTHGQILLIHSMVIDETGGSHGARDYHAILSVEQLPKQKAFGQELYPTIFIKAAVYGRNIIMNHPFTDGNKRTGMLAALIFMENNGYETKAKKGEIEKFALQIVQKKLGLEEVAAWLKKHSKRRLKV